MMIGWCGPLSEASLITKSGYDYIELPLASQGLDLQGEEWKSNLASALASPLPVRAFNYFFPRDMRIAGPELDCARLDAYLARAAEFMGELNSKVAVMGSAWARNVPDGFDRSRAEDQILSALDRCADRLKGTGVTLVIEPLYRKESNIINSVAEGVSFARRVNRPEIKVLADFFHMDEESEPLETLREHRDWVAHIHLADTGRRNPGSGSYPYDRFFGLLKEIDYQGMMSAECSICAAEDLRSSLEFLRRHWPN